MPLLVMVTVAAALSLTNGCSNAAATMFVGHGQRQLNVEGRDS